jgi:hypothetical protein
MRRKKDCPNERPAAQALFENRTVLVRRSSGNRTPGGVLNILLRHSIDGIDLAFHLA